MRRDFFNFFENFFEGYEKFSFPSQDIEYPTDDNKNFTKTEEVIDLPTHSVKKEKWVSVDGTSTFERIVRTTKSKSIEQNEQDLQKQLDQAIKDQNFEKACKLRDQIKQVKALASKNN